MFYLSFLIREAKCAFEIDEVTKEPLICQFLLYAFLVSTSTDPIPRFVRAALRQRLSRWSQEVPTCHGTGYGDLEST